MENDREQIIAKIYGSDFRCLSLKENLDRCYLGAVLMIRNIETESKNWTEETPILTSKYNSIFAIAFILISPIFQNITQWILQDNKSKHEDINWVLHLFDFYDRFAKDDELISIVSNGVDAAFIHSEIMNEYKDIWPNCFLRVNLINDKKELIKNFSEAVDLLQNHIKNNCQFGDIFEFPVGKNLRRPYRAYPRWIKAFKCYGLYNGGSSLKERISVFLNDVVIDDKKDADTKMRDLAGKLISCAMEKKPLAMAYNY